MMSRIKDKQRIALICGFLALVTLAAFWRVLGCDFVNFDDELYVTGNAHVQAGLAWTGITWAFQSQKSSTSRRCFFSLCGF